MARKLPTHPLYVGDRQTTTILIVFYLFIYLFIIFNNIGNFSFVFRFDCLLSSFFDMGKIRGKGKLFVQIIVFNGF